MEKGVYGTALPKFSPVSIKMECLKFYSTDPNLSFIDLTCENLCPYFITDMHLNNYLMSQIF